MSWSLGWHPPDSDLIDVALLAAGKALYLCNSFETKCCDVLRLLHLAEAVMINESDPVVSLEELVSKLRQQPDKMLHETLKDIEASTFMVNMSEDERVTLTKARKARNFIAHEGADIGSLYRVNARLIADFLARLRMAVADLANGDNIVSALLYSAEEPREPAPYVKVNYPALIDLWVFGDLIDDENSKSWSLVYHQGLPGIPDLPRPNIRMS